MGDRGTFMEKLQVLLRPSWWLRSSGIDHEWSTALNFLLDAVESGDAEIERLDEYTARIGGIVIWTANFPSSFGNRYWNGSSGLPRRRVALRLNKALAVADIRTGLRRTRDARTDRHVH